MYTIRNTWGTSSNNVSIMAHSLGNAVMWDALRIYAATRSGQAVKAAISVQGAVWEEAFYSQSPIPCGSPGDANFISYSVADLLTHSWAFWFRQSGKSANTAVGVAYNSYNSVDEALDMMIMSDWHLKDSSIDFPTALGDNHYNRTDVAEILPINRTSDKLANKIPALLRNRVRNYEQSDLNRPIGLSNSLSMTGFSMINAAWPADSEGGYHSSLKKVPFFDVMNWYKNIYNKIQ